MEEESYLFPALLTRHVAHIRFQVVVEVRADVVYNLKQLDLRFFIKIDLMCFIEIELIASVKVCVLGHVGDERSNTIKQAFEPGRPPHSSRRGGNTWLGSRLEARRVPHLA